MSVEKALKIHGWMSEGELGWLSNQAKQRQDVVEIGSWKGRSTMALTSCAGIVYAIDHWKGQPGNTSYNKDLNSIGTDGVRMEFCNNLIQELANRKVFMLNGDRLEMFRFLREWGAEPEMIFIDGDHRYEEVKKDIKEAMDLLKPGGLLCGHDYWPGDIGVMEAVNELLPHRNVFETIWFVTKEIPCGT